jgi:alpha-glucoside transport system substrate-binding protein
LNFRFRRGAIAPLAAVAVLGLALSGCSGVASAAVGAAGKADGIVTISGPIIDHDATLLRESWAGWASSHHIKIVYTGSKNFEEQIGAAAQQGNAPDLAIFEQPGLVKDLATRGYVQPEPASVQSEAALNFPAQWSTYTTANGTRYGAPLLATVKGWVWYSPKQFKSLGVSVPHTWSQLLAVSNELRKKTRSAPWCEGFASADSSGSAGTDWIEDLVLRQSGPGVYDQWVSHKIPFSDPRIQSAFDQAAQILRSPVNVNAGVGGVSSINTTSEAKVAETIASGNCSLTHQDSAFNGSLQAAKSGITVGPQGDMWAFMLPPVTGTARRVTGGGSFVAAFSNDSDTVKVQNYLASTAWASKRVSLGGVISPNVHVSSSTASSPLLVDSIDLLDNSGTTFRFDASDLMPSIVGSGSFWGAMVAWINGTPTNTVLAQIDDSWPTN